MSDTPGDTGSNIPTEHQKAGDAQLPGDTLDRDEEPEGGLEPEDVEDRTNVGTVRPEDYPSDQPDA